MKYFVWTSGAARTTVRLNLGTLVYMARWVESTGECFGVLLGQLRRGWSGLVATIDDFQPFDLSALNGTPHAPPGAGLAMVGLYRRTNREALRLDHVDATLIESTFDRNGMVYLLISAAREGPDRAAFFVPRDGEVHGYDAESEFPFDAEFLRGGPIGGRATAGGA